MGRRHFSEAEKKGLVYRCYDDPLFFMRLIMPDLFDKPSPPFHREIADMIKDPSIEQGNLIVSRSFAKTTVMAVGGALWHIFCSCGARGDKEHKPRFVLLVSKSRPHAMNILTTVKNVMATSSILHELFGYYAESTSERWREDYVITSRKDIIFCRGMLQQVRGLNIHGIRPTYVVADDIEDESNTKTVESMEANFRWFNGALVNCVQPGDSQIINIGTPQHQRSIIFLLKEMDDWKTIHYAAIKVDDEGNRSSLWPEMRSLDWLDQKKASLKGIGRISIFYKEYMCEVIGDEDQLFRPGDIAWWEGDLEKDDEGNYYLLMEKPHKDKRIPVNLFMGVDPASSLSQSADYTCICVIARDSHGNRYLIDMLRKRMKAFPVGDAIIKMFHRYHPKKTQIETVAYQQMLADYVKRQAGVYIPGIEIKNNPRKGKPERIEGLQSLFAQRKVFLRTGFPIMEIFEQELLLFPKGKHEDTVDGFYYANKGSFEPYHTKERVEKRKKKKSLRTYDWQVI